MPRRMNSLRRYTAVASVAALAFTLAACGSGKKNADNLGSVSTISVKDRKPFPELSGTTLDGTKLDLSAYKGKVVVMNLWASWCDACQAESRYLESTYEAYKDKGVQFVGIDARDDSGQGQAFVKDQQITYPSLVDGDDGSLLAKLVGITSLAALPSTLIIDKNGDLAWRALRGIDSAELSAALGPVVAES
ncbi:TlpA family protein disulfide reductase [Catenulispora pinisilvae]|uniref:TlpA family protein disulfide reductase n=1 Tax=Catenulispora pinisilvae TaxID=2705253 RepID=UPI001892339F|nr:TlpA disulfide reductase family protein [Catenulispora pinisilvae]